MPNTLNTILNGAALAIMGAVICGIIWNGIRGKGYKIKFKHVPAGTTRGIVERIVGAIAAFLLFYFVVSLRSNGFTNSNSRHILIWSVIGFVGAIAVGVLRQKNRK